MPTKRSPTDGPGAPPVYEFRPDSGSAASQIYEHLTARILDMELHPFQELSEARLAAELGVSRTPVREALARLARRGLVDIFPQRGTLVSPLSEARVARSRFIREALELPLARLAAENLTPEAGDMMEHEIALQGIQCRAGDDAGFMLSDDRLHAMIARAAGFESIWDDVREAKFQMDRVRRLSLLNRQRMEAIILEHEEIVASLRRHDPDAAQAAVKRHLTSVFRDIDHIRARHPEYFGAAPGAERQPSRRRAGRT